MALSRRANTPTFATHNTADALGIAHSPQEQGLGGIDHLDGIGLQFALVLKNQVIKRRHANRRLASLFSITPMEPTSLS